MMKLVLICVCVLVAVFLTIFFYKVDSRDDESYKELIDIVKNLHDKHGLSASEIAARTKFTEEEIQEMLDK